MLGKIRLRTVSRYSLKNKCLSKVGKRRSPKSPKIGIFAKGLVPGFSQNLDLCVTLFLGKRGPEKNAFLDDKKKRFKNWFFFLEG